MTRITPIDASPCTAAPRLATRRACALAIAVLFLGPAFGGAASQTNSPSTSATASGPDGGPALRAQFGEARASEAVRVLAGRALALNDHGGRPFLIVDKIGAHVYVFDERGVLRGAAPALLGSARGDETVPGIGERPIAEIRPHERTTPAGRFVAETGVNSHGEDIVWVDYDAAVSLHRVRAHNPKERRLQRLATPTVEDNRISYGCINVPAKFYDAVVVPAMRGGRAIVYVLPEAPGARALLEAPQAVGMR